MKALANPILALEEMGYVLTDEYRSHLERVLRFPPETARKLEALREQIHKLVGRPFEIDSPTELERLLFEDLKLPRVGQTLKAQAGPSQLPSNIPDIPTVALPPQMSWGKRLRDPLEELRGAHPIMEPLLAYRQLEASRPRLASPELYKKIDRGEVKLPITRLRFRVRGPRKPK